MKKIDIEQLQAALDCSGSVCGGSCVDLPACTPEEEESQSRLARKGLITVSPCESGVDSEHLNITQAGRAKLAKLQKAGRV